MASTTPLLFAIEKGDLAEVERRIKAGESVDTVGEYDFGWGKISGVPILSIAVVNQHQPIVEFLVQQGAKVDIQDEAGESALHYACVDPKSVSSLLLLKHGAKPDIPNKMGDTAFHFACDSDSSHTLSLLLRYGVHTHIKNKRGKTGMDIARERGNTECVKHITQWRALRPLHAFCTLKACSRDDIDISRLPHHLQQEISEIRKSPIEEWPILIDQISQNRLCVGPTLSTQKKSCRLQ
eukprot:TRINITY_DN8487_c0_g1_i1.p1 TRINITY_DN8487_c0_g1~~TRINITY_DN8487_c0_g1_i1.p1  ORF type:complete len:262 (-),score=66.62 TRINITY_DN8487_c0_g1_i1:7-720(-)